MNLRFLKLSCKIEEVVNYLSEYLDSDATIALKAKVINAQVLSIFDEYILPGYFDHWLEGDP